MTQPAMSPAPPIAIFAREARHYVEAVAVAVSGHVVAGVDHYDDDDGNGRQFVEEVVAGALHEFLDLFDGIPHRDRGVARQFRIIGQRHATSHSDPSSLYAALHVAARAVPGTLAKAGGPTTEDPALIGLLATAAHRYLAHMSDEITTGFNLARHQRHHIFVRQDLIDRLLAGQLTTDDLAYSPLPELLVAVVAEPPATLDEADLPREPENGELMMTRRGRHMIVLAAPENAEQAVALLTAGATRVAVSWPVKPSEIPAAVRWARRAHQLARSGIIPDAPLIDCAEHRTQIWLHAEPALRRRACQDLLAPLLAESPNSREILSETLLAWLETRESAPTIAARLGVHAQTVRYRWKRINELFGEALHDPEFIVQVSMLLKASVPLWKAGDQSDFELFQTGTPT